MIKRIEYHVKMHIGRQGEHSQFWFVFLAQIISEQICSYEHITETRYQFLRQIEWAYWNESVRYESAHRDHINFVQKINK